MCMNSLPLLHPPSEGRSEIRCPVDRQGYTRGDTHELEVVASSPQYADLGRPFCFRGVKMVMITCRHLPALLNL
jgi:hypothetical protein